MTKLTASSLVALLDSIYQGVGVPANESKVVAGHQTESNLVGHDSHGAIRTRSYVDRIRRGDIVPGAEFEIERETDTTAVINGNWGLGFVQTERATEVALEKARSSGVAAITIRHQGHMGRLGHYTERIARAGMIGILMADSGRGPKAVVPFGGREARLGTNPISVGIPAPAHPLVLDMATSAVAGGKVQYLRNVGGKLEPGWLVDSRGEPSIDPEDYYNGGSLLPLGGSQGHKGYGLSVVVEVLCALLPGLGYGVAEDGRHNDGNFLAVFDVARFRDPEEFATEMDGFVEHLRATPPASGYSEVMVPGEPEVQAAALRRRHGIELDDTTWKELCALAAELGLDDSLLDGAA